MQTLLITTTCLLLFHILPLHGMPHSHNHYQRDYSVESIVSTVTFSDHTCSATIHEEIVMRFDGDFGRLGRSVSFSNLPQYRPKVESVKIHANYSQFVTGVNSRSDRWNEKNGKYELEVTFDEHDTYVTIVGNLNGRTSSEKTTHVKFVYDYKMFGPYRTITKNSGEKLSREFETSWNIKFKSVQVKHAEIRFEYPNKVFTPNSHQHEFTQLKNGMHRITIVKQNIPPGESFKASVTGQVTHEYANQVPNCDPKVSLAEKMILSTMVVGFVILVANSIVRWKNTPPGNGSITTAANTDAVADTSNDDGGGGYDSDGGCSCGSGGWAD